MEHISIGSIVQLKTDGPKMTVKAYGTKLDYKSWYAKRVEDTEHVCCQWFDKEGTLREGDFPVASLKLIESQ